ncbi:MAG: phage tail spike protein [Lachnospiraceae bacterium]
MYRIICETNGKVYPIFDLRDSAYIVQNPKLTLELNKTGSLVFYMNMNHPNYGCIKKITSIISVYLIRKDGSEKWIYSGRSLTDEEDFYRTGKIECEGILAFLLDSIVRDYSFEGTPKDYFTYLIKQHNSHVGEGKQFQIGTIDLEGVDSNDNIVRASTQKPNTLTEINSKVINLLDCYVSARNVSGTYYIDCLKEMGDTNAQEIRYGVNLLGLKKNVSAIALYTVMIGMGAANSNGKLTVEVEDQEAIAEFGRIEGKVEFSDVTLEENLLTKTTEYLKQYTGYKRTIEVSAIDMNIVDESVQEISLGYINVYSEPHGLSERMLISKMELNLMNPEENKYTLGISQNAYKGISEVKKEIASISAGSSNQSGSEQSTEPLTTDEIKTIITGAMA